MKLSLAILFLFCVSGCSDSEDVKEPENPTSSEESTEGLCIYTPDGEGGVVNLGQYMPSEFNEFGETQEEELARCKVDYFIATCNGDVIINIDSHDTNDSNNQSGDSVSN